MHYAFETKENILILKIQIKRATAEISGQLKNDLINKIEEGYNRIVVDLSDTVFVDSSFLGVLLAGLKKVTIQNGDLKIAGLQSQVKNMFELTRLYRIFDVFEKAEDGVKSFEN